MEAGQELISGGEESLFVNQKLPSLGFQMGRVEAHNGAICPLNLLLILIN